MKFQTFSQYLTNYLVKSKGINNQRKKQQQKRQYLFASNFLC